MLLVKLIEPPCTERYARWCERSGNLVKFPSYSINEIRKGREAGDKMKVQGILVATVCLLLCFTGCAVPGQTETTSSGESHSAESTASLDDADFQQESAGFAPKDQMTEPFTGS